MFMELIMQECELRYLEGTFSQQIPVEETAELIVPDKCEDAEAIVDSFGTLTVKDSRWEGEELQIGGTVQGAVLLLTRDGQVHRVEASVPFSLKRQIPREGDKGTVRFHCQLSSVEGKILNSRKLLLRVGILCDVQLFEERERILHSMEEPDPTLQLRKAVYPVKMPVELGSKSFTLSDEPELPELTAPVARLLKAVCCPRVLEQKAVGSKGVFKMELLLHILYADPEERLCSYEWRIPLSQYVDFSRDVEGAQIQTCLQLTDFELEPDSRVQSRRLFLRLGLVAQSLVYEVRELELIEDGFCTNATLLPTWEQWQCRSLLDSRELTAEARWRTEEGISDLVDVWAQPMEPELLHQGDVLYLKLPVSCSMVYYDTEGQLRGRTVQTCGETELLLHAGAFLRAEDLSCGQVYCNAGPKGAELRIPIQLRADSFANQTMTDLAEAQIKELPQSFEPAPSLIIRRTEGEESLWEIAKSYNASVEAIVGANALESDLIPADTLLLIPL